MATSPNREFLASLIDPEALYQQAPCGYFSFIPDGTIIKINETLLKWSGLRRDKVEYQMKFSDLTSQGGKIYYELFYLPAIQMQGTVNEVNFEIRKIDGTVFPALLNAVGIRDKDGQLVAINVTVQDITERKRYEAELLTAKKKADDQRADFEFLSDFIPEMIWMANAVGKITYVNRRFLDYFHITRGQLPEDFLHKSIHPEDVENYVGAMKEAVRNAEVFEFKLRISNALNQFEWHRIRGIPFTEEGVVTKWLGSWSNIDAHVNELNRRDDFLSIASHELKTPLTTLKVGLQLLSRIKETPNSPLHISLIDQSLRSMDKVSGLIDELLNVKRLEESELRLNKAIFELSYILERSCAHVRLEGKFELIVDADTGLLVEADEHRLEQMVVNFVNNAVKYAPNSRQIYLSAKLSEGMAKVTVRDTGPGIPTDKQPYLFDRYYRGDHSGDDYTGLGLGLYICAETVRLHDGKIGVESILGQGASFWFALPIIKID
ncbi:MAG: PAS domain-containing sensor histidine kinase [Sphingobacteriaceae bacterium]